MNPWLDLYRQHGALRAMNDREAANEVRRVLRKLSEKPYAVLRGDAPARLVEGRVPRSDTVQYTLGREREGEALELEDLPFPLQEAVALRSARLAVLLRFNRRAERLQEMNIMLSGVRRDASPWAVAVHLPPDGQDRDGLGACGHAALHCHIGPTLDAKPKVRVPFPPLRPAQVVEWAVSQVVPTAEFEPAPWPRVEAMLQPT
ncbi:hypothetical protein [Nannocystis punicea]|uniref:Uncharacterized protein n=1 Tax=Nannocystis punicea TaxID=2995304 RepID=A0ABY7HF73_9BACT|nr:hypothetical protein [Nannocystis poenicansa]WAS97934.1 hypothetical protein O0S08_17475 [Nannocystis poenicansa]